MHFDNVISLVKLNKNSAIMARNGAPLACPFRQPEFRPHEKRTLQGVVTEFQRSEVKCGTWCPHFNIQKTTDEETSKPDLIVLLTCGTNDTAHQIHEVIEPQQTN